MPVGSNHYKDVVSQYLLQSDDVGNVHRVDKIVAPPVAAISVKNEPDMPGPLRRHSPSHEPLLVESLDRRRHSASEA